MLNGAADPTGGIGTDGDFYINTTTDFIFGPKTAGAWGTGTSLVGPQGPAGGGSGWSLTGNAGTVNGTNFIGTTDNIPLTIRVNNLIAGRLDHLSFNTFLGHIAGRDNTTGIRNTALGSAAMQFNTTGEYNTAVGMQSLRDNTLGGFNTAAGYRALVSNTTGNLNVASGYMALNSNTTGSGNSAFGYQALYTNSNSHSNVAIGIRALFQNNNRSNLVAVGDSALYNNSVGAVFDPIEGISEGFSNTAVGSKALYANTTGSGNTALGSGTLDANVGGDYNTALGSFALSSSTSSDNCTAVGRGALGTTTASFNTALGSLTGPSSNTSSNTTSLGYQATCTGGNMVRAGNSAVASIGGYAGWTTLPSDGRFKRNVAEDVKGLDFVLRLRPVTYNIEVDKIAAHLGEDSQLDAHGNKMPLPLAPEMAQARAEKSAMRYTGFIAQEVDAAAQAVGFEFSGVDKSRESDDMLGLRYAEFVVPLVKAVQEQQAQIESQQKEIAELKALMQQLLKR